MSNIDDDAPEFELDDLNMPNDGMPDPMAAEPAAAEAAAPEPVSLDDAEPVEEPLDNIEAEEETKKPAAKKAGMTSQLSKANPYTVMLAISVLAIGVALLCLILEWSTYGFQRKPPKTLTMSRVENTLFSGVYVLNSQDNSSDPAGPRTS